MLKKASILPDMLLILHKRTYVFYAFACSYVLIVLMATFCKECHVAAESRMKRDSLPNPRECSQRTCRVECSTVNGCSQCQDDFFLLIQNEYSSCVPTCPNKYYGHRSSQSHNLCKRCADDRCERCSVDYCSLCKKGYVEKGGRCRRRCPANYSRRISTRQCISCNCSNCERCSSENFCSRCSRGYYKHRGKCRLQCPSGFTKHIIKNQCKRNVRCKLTAWSKWSSCTRNQRGNCTKHRTRKISQPPSKPGSCPSPMKQTRICPKSRCRPRRKKDGKTRRKMHKSRKQSKNDSRSHHSSKQSKIADCKNLHPTSTRTKCKKKRKKLSIRPST